MRAPDFTILVHDSTLSRILCSKTNARTVVIQHMNCYTCWLNGSFKDEWIQLILIQIWLLYGNKVFSYQKHKTSIY